MKWFFGLALIFWVFCASMALAQEGIPDLRTQRTLAWDPTDDPRVRRTDIFQCTGSIMQCAANPDWPKVGEAPMPDTSYVVTVFEGNLYNWNAKFCNPDEGCSLPSNTVEEYYVPFAQAPEAVPAGLRVVQ